MCHTALYFLKFKFEGEGVSYKLCLKSWLKKSPRIVLLDLTLTSGKSKSFCLPLRKCQNEYNNQNIKPDNYSSLLQHGQEIEDNS